MSPEGHEFIFNKLLAFEPNKRFNPINLSSEEYLKDVLQYTTIKVQVGQHAPAAPRTDTSSGDASGTISSATSKLNNASGNGTGNQGTGSNKGPHGAAARNPSGPKAQPEPAKNVLIFLSLLMYLLGQLLERFGGRFRKIFRILNHNK